MRDRVGQAQRQEPARSGGGDGSRFPGHNNDKMT